MEITKLSLHQYERVKPACSRWIPRERYRTKGENRERRESETVNTIILCSL